MFVAFLFNNVEVDVLRVELQLASLIVELLRVPSSSGNLLSTSVANDQRSDVSPEVEELILTLLAGGSSICRYVCSSFNFPT